MSDAFEAWGRPAPIPAPEWEWGDDLCAPFVDLVPVTGASISVFRLGGNHATVCASSPLARRLDDMQFGLGEGPRWDVARTGAPSISTDVARDDHPDWPVFAAGLAKLGVGALFAYPIMTGPVMVGVVDLYRCAAGPLTHGAKAKVLSLARKVALPAVQQALRAAAGNGSEPQTNPTLRREVHQAVGMVFVQLEVTTAEALALLRAYAFSTGRPLENVARDVVDRVIDFRDLPE
jgi:hypothetical protein